MSKIIKRFKPKFQKYVHTRRSGLGQTGAHGTSHRMNPPDIHRLGWAPRPYTSGMTGEPNSSIMGRMGTGSLSVYTDVEREEFEDQSGMPGKGGNYKVGMSRQYKNKGGGKAMQGAPQDLSEEMLRDIIKSVIEESKPGELAFSYEILAASASDEDDELEEFSGAAAVAGYSLPLGASNKAKGEESQYGPSLRAFGNGTIVSSKAIKILRR